MIKLDSYSGIVGVTPNPDGTSSVEVKSGTRLHDLNTLLEEQVRQSEGWSEATANELYRLPTQLKTLPTLASLAPFHSSLRSSPPSTQGLALPNLGATAAQSIAGAISTSTHGTGRELGSISSDVTGIRLIDADGNVHDSREDSDVLLFGRVSLGVLGVISTVTVKAVPIFKMRLSKFDVPLSELLTNHEQYYDNYTRFQWSFVPYTDTATVLLREPVDWNTPITDCWAGSVVYPCVDVSYKTLVDSLERYDNRTLYTEMEMFVDVENVLPAVSDFIEFQASIKDSHDGSVCSLFTNIRYVAKDDIPTSPMYQRDIAVLSFICLGTQDHTGDPEEFERYASGLEGIASEKYNGVPHWGKQNYATHEDISAFYKDLDSFNAFRAKIDPNGIFLNEYTRTRLGIDGIDASVVKQNYL